MLQQCARQMFHLVYYHFSPQADLVTLDTWVGNVGGFSYHHGNFLEGRWEGNGNFLEGRWEGKCPCDVSGFGKMKLDRWQVLYEIRLSPDFCRKRSGGRSRRR